MAPTSRRPPLAVLPRSAGVSATELITAARRSAAPKPPIEAHSASAPVTCGAAMDVPLYAAYRLRGTVDVMLEPGAARSTEVAPQLEYGARPPVLVSAATLIMQS